MDLRIQAIKNLWCPMRNPNRDQGVCPVRGWSKTKHPQLEEHLCIKCPLSKHEKVAEILVRTVLALLVMTVSSFAAPVITAVSSNGSTVTLTYSDTATATWWLIYYGTKSGTYPACFGNVYSGSAAMPASLFAPGTTYYFSVTARRSNGTFSNSPVFSSIQ